MKTKIDLGLLIPTDAEWIKVVLNDFDNFLLDHAACERKASALALSFVWRFPHLPKLVEPMITLAQEELAHFHAVYRLIAKRQLTLAAKDNDPYLKALLAHVRHGDREYLLDRLLIFSLVEARGFERFNIVAENLEDEKLKTFYAQLAKEEAGHYKIFLNIANDYFSEHEVSVRLAHLQEIEASVIKNLVHRPAVH